MTNLEKIRKEKGLSQIEVARHLGVPQNTISRWERGIHYPKKDRLIQLADFYGVTIDALINNNLPVQSTHTHIPVLGTVAAGIPITAEENIIDWEEISSNVAMEGDFFALQITGDSMLPYIAPGDIVIVKQTPVVRSGAVAIVLVNGDEGTCKKVFFRDNGIELRAYNTDVFPPKLYTRKEVMTLPVTICGEVVEVRKKVLP